MPVADDLKVYLRAETAAAVRAMKKAQKQTDSLEGRTRAMVKTAVKSFGGYVAAAASIGAVVKLLKSSVDAYGEQVKAEEQLSAAIRSTGGDVDELMPKYKTLASEIQNATTVGDEATLALMQQARSMGVTDDRMEEVTKGAIGLSKALGMNTKQALRGVTNAFNGTFTTLQRYIPELRTADTESEKLAIVQQKMADGFDIAQAEADTAHGNMQQLSNVVGDLKEELGESVAVGINPFIQGLTDMVSKLQEAKAEANDTKQALITYGDEFNRFLETGSVSAMTIGQLTDVLEQARKEYQASVEADIHGGDERQKAFIQLLEDELEVKERIRENERTRNQILSEYGEKSEQYKQWLSEQEEHMENLTAAYAKTKEGQIAAVEEQIRYFESFKRGPMAVAVLEHLRDKLEELTDKGEEAEDAQEHNLGTLVAIGDRYFENEKAAKQWMQSTRDEFASMTQSNVDRIEEQKQRYLDAGVARVDAERWASDQIKKIHKQELQEKIDLGMQYVSTAQDMFSSIAQIMSNSYQAQIDAAESNDERQKELMREQAAAQKRWATFQALINTATAVTKTFALHGFPGGVPLAALQAAAGAAQVTAIQSQPIPAFAKGGDFTTTGPQMIMVGEKGKERVRIDPQPDSRSDGVVININGNMYGPGGAEEFAGYVVSAIKRGQRAGRVESL